MHCDFMCWVHLKKFSCNPLHLKTLLLKKVYSVYTVELVMKSFLMNQME